MNGNWITRLINYRGFVDRAACMHFFGSKTCLFCGKTCLASEKPCGTRFGEIKIPLLSTRGKWLIKYRRGKMFKEDFKGYVALVAVAVLVMWANGGI